MGTDKSSREKFCPNCGCSIGEKAKFCEQCGAKMDDYTVKPQGTAEQKLKDKPVHTFPLFVVTFMALPIPEEAWHIDAESGHNEAVVNGTFGLTQIAMMTAVSIQAGLKNPAAIPALLYADDTYRRRRFVSNPDWDRDCHLLLKAIRVKKPEHDAFWWLIAYSHASCLKVAKAQPKKFYTKPELLGIGWQCAKNGLMLVANDQGEARRAVEHALKVHSYLAPTAGMDDAFLNKYRGVFNFEAVDDERWRIADEVAFYVLNPEMLSNLEPDNTLFQAVRRDCTDSGHLKWGKREYFQLVDKVIDWVVFAQNALDNKVAAFEGAGNQFKQEIRGQITTLQGVASAKAEQSLKESVSRAETNLDAMMEKTESVEFALMMYTDLSLMLQEMVASAEVSS